MKIAKFLNNSSVVITHVIKLYETLDRKNKLLKFAAVDYFQEFTTCCWTFFEGGKTSKYFMDLCSFWNSMERWYVDGLFM